MFIFQCDLLTCILETGKWSIPALGHRVLELEQPWISHPSPLLSLGGFRTKPAQIRGSETLLGERPTPPQGPSVVRLSNYLKVLSRWPILLVFCGIRKQFEKSLRQLLNHPVTFSFQDWTILLSSTFSQRSCSNNNLIFSFVNKCYLNLNQAFLTLT